MESSMKLYNVFGVPPSNVGIGCSRMVATSNYGSPIERNFAPITPSARYAKECVRYAWNEDRLCFFMSMKDSSLVTRLHAQLMTNGDDTSLSVHSAIANEVGLQSMSEVWANGEAQLFVVRLAGSTTRDRGVNLRETIIAG